ncbi:hypothetical protein LTR74_000816 [Friedmanniomyces endolithicus]|nr:hypothetical protein LTR74_000816 [Friedmanniomyces endolithicus]
MLAHDSKANPNARATRSSTPSTLRDRGAATRRLATKNFFEHQLFQDGRSLLSDKTAADSTRHRSAQTWRCTSKRKANFRDSWRTTGEKQTEKPDSRDAGGSETGMERNLRTASQRQRETDEY